MDWGQGGGVWIWRSLGRRLIKLRRHQGPNGGGVRGGGSCSASRAAPSHACSGLSAAWPAGGPKPPPKKGKKAKEEHWNGRHEVRANAQHVPLSACTRAPSTELPANLARQGQKMYTVLNGATKAPQSAQRLGSIVEGDDPDMGHAPVNPDMGSGARARAMDPFAHHHSRDHEQH